MTMKATVDMSEIGRHQRDSSRLIPYPNPGWLRLFSLLLASSLSALLLTYPRAVATSLSEVNHTLLFLVMWGIATGFIHGVGFVPRMIIWRIVFNPFIGWPLMATGFLSMLAAA